MKMLICIFCPFCHTILHPQADFGRNAKICKLIISMHGKVLRTKAAYWTISTELKKVEKERLPQKSVRKICKELRYGDCVHSALW